MQIGPKHIRVADAGSLQFGIWLPVYGSWLRTRELPTSGSVTTCLAIAKQARELNYDFLYASENLLNPIHGPAAKVIDAWSLIASIAPMIDHIGLIGAIKPGFRSPLQVARTIDTIASMANRSVSMSVVCGWWKEEFDKAGVAWLNHDERYNRADNFVTELYELFDGPELELSRPFRPDLWVAGHSSHAIELAAKHSGCLFLNGMHDEALAGQIRKVKMACELYGTSVKIAINAHVIAEPTQQAARDRLDRLVAQRNLTSIAYFRRVMAQSGAVGWEGLSDVDMVDSNAGFAAGLIGSYRELSARLISLRSIGVDRIICQFDDAERDAAVFMHEVVSPVRAYLEKENSVQSP